MPPTAETGNNPPNVTIIHPDLGIGGAERLIIDVALALQSRGHRVTIYTSHRDPAHCFEEARDGTLDVRVRGNTVFPAHVGGRLHVLMAVLRQLHLTAAVLGELSAPPTRSTTERKDDEGGEGRGDIFIVDQLAACVPVLKTLGELFTPPSRRDNQRILFYCHFPDQLLARRDEGSSLLRVAKGFYRCPFDWFEGWAMSAADKVVANSRFTRGVVSEVFGGGSETDKLGDVRVVYPCVDTDQDGPDDSGAKKIWDGKRILLSINRFERKKGMELAIRAYHGLGDEERRAVRLVVAGMIYSFVHSSLGCCILMAWLTDSRRLRQPRPRKRTISRRTRRPSHVPRTQNRHRQNHDLRTLHPRLYRRPLPPLHPLSLPRYPPLPGQAPPLHPNQRALRHSTR